MRTQLTTLIQQFCEFVINFKVVITISNYFIKTDIFEGLSEEYTKSDTYANHMTVEQMWRNIWLKVLVPQKKSQSLLTHLSAIALKKLVSCAQKFHNSMTYKIPWSLFLYSSDFKKFYTVKYFSSINITNAFFTRGNFLSNIFPKIFYQDISFLVRESVDSTCECVQWNVFFFPDALSLSLSHSLSPVPSPSHPQTSWNTATSERHLKQQIPQ